MTKKMDLRSSCLSTEVCYTCTFSCSDHDARLVPGHTARPTDFCWAPGESEIWTASTTSEDNVVMVWQPTMRIWAGDQVKIDEKELEGDAMEGVESVPEAGPSKVAAASGANSARSQSMSISASVSNSGVDVEVEDS
jgi:histone-binding protein RBBP4